ncbi:MAG: hypothetical protein MZV64_09795 [Ignavibacteriales bacterium]|nr:hypothetical protein [Ignavibacteriales bacterium]
MWRRLVTLCFTSSISLPFIFSEGTFSRANIRSTSTSRRMVPCWRMQFRFRVWALPETFCPWTSTSLMGANSAARPNRASPSTTPAQRTR